MSSKNCLCKLRKFIVFSLLKILWKIPMAVCNRLTRMTLRELLWLVLIVFILIVFWTYEQEEKYESPSNPVIVWWTDGFPGTSGTTFCPEKLKCEVFCDKSTRDSDAYLFYGSNINIEDLPLPRHANKILWGLYHEESPRNIEELLHEEMLNLFNLSSTFSRHSDVPFPLQYLNSAKDVTSTEYFVETSIKNKYLNDIAPIMYLQSDCETSTERDKYVKELMKLIKVDSYGLCLNNKELPSKFTEDYLNNLDNQEFLRFVARYKFVIAIENGVCDDYITEKFWRAIRVGSVPIYFGSPSVKDWFPNTDSAVLINDYPTPEVLHNHIKLLLENDTLYEGYLEHKTKQIITNKKLVEELRLRSYQLDALATVKKFECLVCKKLHQKSEKVSIVGKKHYNCPKPISALTQSVNPRNDWVYSWQAAKERVKKLYKNITEQ
ncbi:alpha-(1,3)-fucosyltransferase B [Plodia interpunctella]|uniref:alpha-(1,3)-fucosyltransferase B n=1 Tax=Plodia interpunctella TaxID=58824 RepID=UPI002368B728|nr:alpha-(1,3)-fucosyltransferase B [Plodia interpunctella]XP_053607416.1 alpha-(1,3)-fucosyltransferase B [Plodia interpunctella]XP_053607417.1 alpha-(1,3)-fucosyltransferase B [Plodia interpunctella]